MTDNTNSNNLPQKDLVNERYLKGITDFSNTNFNYIRRKEKNFYFEKKIGDKKHMK